MDELDIASDRAELEREMLARQIQRRATKREAEPTGECLACGDSVAAPKLFCHGECAERFELLKRRRVA